MLYSREKNGFTEAASIEAGFGMKITSRRNKNFLKYPLKARIPKRTRNGTL